MGENCSYRQISDIHHSASKNKLFYPFKHTIEVIFIYLFTENINKNVVIV